MKLINVNPLFQQAVENPTSTEIQDVCAAVGFNVLLEVILKKKSPHIETPQVYVSLFFHYIFFTTCGSEVFVLALLALYDS